MVWIPVVLGGLVLVGVLAAVLLFRLRPHVQGLSPEERAEMASAPMPRQQKRAWWGLAIGVVTLAVISTILFKQGAAEYWENDDLRLLVVGIFLGGLFAYMGTVLPVLAERHREGSMDEVDRLVLSRAPNVQSAAVLVALAVWLTSLTRMLDRSGSRMGSESKNFLGHATNVPNFSMVWEKSLWQMVSTNPF